MPRENQDINRRTEWWCWVDDSIDDSVAVKGGACSICGRTESEMEDDLERIKGPLHSLTFDDARKRVLPGRKPAQKPRGRLKE